MAIFLLKYALYKFGNTMMNKAIVVFLSIFSLAVFAAQTDISPIGKVRVSDAASGAGSAAAPAKPKTGKEIYDSVCMACHATGAAGAPKVGDVAAWAPRIAAGMDVMMKTAISGKGAMPPKGGNMGLSDAEIKSTVEYMLENSK